MTIEDDFIICCACNKKFKMINNKHLQSHGLTAEQYREQYPGHKLSCESVARRRSQHISENNRRRAPMSEAGRQRIREANTGKSPGNKGIKLTAEQKQARQHIYEQREQKKKETNWQHPRLGITLSQDTRDKISRSLKGRTLTETHIENVKKASIESNINKRLKTLKKYENIWENNNFNFVYDNENKTQSKNVKLQCRSCNTEYNYAINSSYSHTKTNICTVCYPNNFKSKAELEILNFIQNLLPGEIVISGDKTVLNPLELDIYLPNKNIAIEYCGLYYHGNRSGKHKFYHNMKYSSCRDKNIRLVQIFEDEYVHNKEVTLHNLRNILLDPTIDLDNFEIKIVDELNSDNFLNLYDVHKTTENKISYGLYRNNELIQVCAFKNTDYGFRLARYGRKIEIKNSLNLILEKFIADIKPEEIKFYLDLRWESIETFDFFTKEKSIQPIKWATLHDKRFKITPKSTSYIYDAGYYLMSWKKPG